MGTQEIVGFLPSCTKNSVYPTGESTYWFVQFGKNPEIFWVFTLFWTDYTNIRQIYMYWMYAIYPNILRVYGYNYAQMLVDCTHSVIYWNVALLKTWRVIIELSTNWKKYRVFIFLFTYKKDWLANNQLTICSIYIFFFRRYCLIFSPILGSVCVREK